MGKVKEKIKGKVKEKVKMKLDMKIDIPWKLKRFFENPTPYISATMKEADRDALTLLENEISKAAPKKSGALSRSIDIDINARKVFTNSVYGRAVEIGHYAVPKGKYLHFISSGKDVFLKFTRSRKQPFFFKTMHANKIKILDIYDEAFKKLLENV